VLKGKLGVPKQTLKSMRSVDHTSAGTLLDEIDVVFVGVDGTLLGVVSGSDGSQVSDDSSFVNLAGYSLESCSLLHYSVSLDS